MEDLITYETLYEFLRKEKYSSELEEIDKEFYAKAVNYLKEKQKIIEAQRGKDSIFAAEAMKTQRQFDNALKLIREIYERREGKIFNLAMLSSRVRKKEVPSNMLQEENTLYIETLEILNRYRRGILDNMLAAKKPKLEETAPKAIKRQQEETGSKVIRFTNPVPKFVAEDLKPYGPFEKEDVASIPQKAAKVIMGKKRGEEMHNETQQEST